MAQIKEPKPAGGWVAWNRSTWHAVPPGFSNWKPRTVCGFRVGSPRTRLKSRPSDGCCKACVGMVDGTWNP